MFSSVRIPSLKRKHVLEGSLTRLNAARCDILEAEAKGRKNKTVALAFCRIVEYPLRVSLLEVQDITLLILRKEDVASGCIIELGYCIPNSTG